MVSFSCEVCSDILKKPKLDSHAARCHGAYYTCIDCSKTFAEGQWKGHTSCISEAEKYQGSSYKPEKGKGKKGEKGRENDAAATDAIVTTTVPAVKAKKDKKKGSPETIATPAADSPPAESPDQPKPSKKEKKKSKKVKKDKKDKRSEDTPAIGETSPGSAPAAEAVDNGRKRKSASADDAMAKKKKKRGGDEKKAKSSQEKLAELVGDEELRLEVFLERLEEAAGSAYDKVIEGVAFQGLRVKADGGKAVLLFNW